MKEDAFIRSRSGKSVINIGDEGFNVFIVDNFLSNPEILKQSAIGLNGWKNTQDFYPGIKKSVSDVCREKIEKSVKSKFESDLNNEFQMFFKENKFSKINIKDCYFSMATSLPQELLPIQSIPHYDTTQENVFAMVYYLCDSSLGGTAFYKHKETGFESISCDREALYMKSLERQATTIGLPASGYICGSTSLFEQVANVSARFNRAIFYPSHLLHSGNIQAPGKLSDDPSCGRLTVTGSIRFY